MKKIIILIMLVLSFAMVIAEESAFEEASAFGEESAFSEESAFGDESAFAEEGESAFGDEGFGENSFESESSSFGEEIGGIKLEFNGKIELNSRVYTEIDNQTESNADLELKLKASKDNSEFYSEIIINDEKEIEIDEAYMRIYYDKYEVEAGKMKVVWGKGDKLHVLDLLNSESFEDFINPDYLDRRQGENMLKVNLYPNEMSEAKVEFVFIPEWNANMYDLEGKWMPNDLRAVDMIAKSAGEKLSNLLPSSSTFEKSQVGIRYTNSINGYDFGIMGYLGSMKEYSYEKTAVATYQAGGYASFGEFEKGLDLHNDRIGVIGGEFGAVIATINTRAELGYIMTSDDDGDETGTMNNRIVWLAGGDRALPIHNLNLNVQVKSELILEDEEIKKNGAADIDFDEDEDYLTNLIVVNIDDSFKNEKILPEVNFVYNLEKEDYMIETSLEMILKDDASLKMSYKLFEGEEDTDFGQFDDNDFVEVTAKYEF